MKLLTLHKKISHINYKHSICSFATLFVISTTIFAVLAPFYIVSGLYKDSWSEYKIVYEQPDVLFKHNYIISAEFLKTVQDELMPPRKIIACSTYKYLNDIFGETPSCSHFKVSFKSLEVLWKSLFFFFLVLGQ